VFIVNDARWFAPDTVYLLFVRAGVIAGARVGGQLVASRRNYPTEATAYAKPKLLIRWAAADPLAPDFLSSDRKNFAYPAAELCEAHVSSRRALWTAPIPNSGTVTLVPRTGRKRKLILLGEQDSRAIQRLLISNGVPVTPLAAQQAVAADVLMLRP